MIRILSVAPHVVSRFVAAFLPCHLPHTVWYAGCYLLSERSSSKPVRTLCLVKVAAFLDDAVLSAAGGVLSHPIGADDPAVPVAKAVCVRKSDDQWSGPLLQVQ